MEMVAPYSSDVIVWRDVHMTLALRQHLFLSVAARELAPTLGRELAIVMEFGVIRAAKAYSTSNNAGRLVI